MRLFRYFVRCNVWLSEAIERVLPSSIRTDGNEQFHAEFLPLALEEGAVVWDVGSGSRPYISATTKRELGIRVVGTDISAEELLAAPPGSYDDIVVADLCTFEGSGEADFAICQAVLEHVQDNEGAMRALATIIKPGGRILIFAPSRNAAFARLNLVLPESLKRKLLFSLFPHKAQGHDGFKAYYDRCVPREFERLARENGLEIDKRQLFWVSSYFKVFVPLYLLWRAYQVTARIFIGDQAAETFAYIFRKPSARKGA